MWNWQVEPCGGARIGKWENSIHAWVDELSWDECSHSLVLKLKACITDKSGPIAFCVHYAIENNTNNNKKQKTIHLFNKKQKILGLFY